RAVAERHPVVDENRNAAQRAELAEPVVAEEGHDGVEAIGNSLHLANREHLAHVRRDRVADNGCGIRRHAYVIPRDSKHASNFAALDSHQPGPSYDRAWSQHWTAASPSQTQLRCGVYERLVLGDWARCGPGWRSREIRLTLA